MNREEAIKILQGAIKKPNTKDGYLGQAIDMAIKALELLSCITDRPCSVCKYHKEKGCSKWDCVFDGEIGEKE